MQETMKNRTESTILTHPTMMTRASNMEPIPKMSNKTANVNRGNCVTSSLAASLFALAREMQNKEYTINRIPKIIEITFGKNIINIPRIIMMQLYRN